MPSIQQLFTAMPRCQRIYGWDADVIQRLVLNAVGVTLLPPAEKADMSRSLTGEFERMRETPRS